MEELDAFWPIDFREQGKLPSPPAPESLEVAMRNHGSRTLEQHEKLIAEHG